MQTACWAAQLINASPFMEIVNRNGPLRLTQPAGLMESVDPSNLQQTLDQSTLDIVPIPLLMPCPITGCTMFCTGTKILEIQILEPQSLTLYIVIVLSCPLIGSCNSSTANQRAAQNNCMALGSQDLYFLKYLPVKFWHDFRKKSVLKNLTLTQERRKLHIPN